MRLVKGWTVDDTLDQPETAATAILWFEARFNQTLLEVEDSFAKYRLSDALMAIYKLIWDDFCSWYLEMVKTGMDQPLDRKTYQATILFFENLMKVLHPFMPFITEEIWHLLAERTENDDLIVARKPVAKAFDKEVLAQFEYASEVILAVRKLRADKNMPYRNPIELAVKKSMAEANTSFDGIVAKLCNISEISYVEEAVDGAFGFVARSTEFFVPASENVNVEAELEKLEQELTYTRGFLNGVVKKLSNERFVIGAPSDVVDRERKKMQDAEARIQVIQQQMAGLKK